jgi:hypothetical protein
LFEQQFDSGQYEIVATGRRSLQIPKHDRSRVVSYQSTANEFRRAELLEQEYPEAHALKRRLDWVFHELQRRAVPDHETHDRK